jgi:hypothetical protein
MRFEEHATGKFFAADDATFRYSIKTWGADHTDVIIERKDPPEVVFGGTIRELRELRVAFRHVAEFVERFEQQTGSA